MALIKSLLKVALHSVLSVSALVRLRFSSKPLLVILTYHRILPAGDPIRKEEQPGMVTSPQTLKRHIDLFRQLGATPMHLGEWLEKKEKHQKLPKFAVAFTFDDGWRDNYEHAFPLLEAHGLPFTIFLVSKLVDTQETFWPEKVIKLLTSDMTPHAAESFSWLKPYMTPPTQENCCGPLTLEAADEVVSKLKSLDDIEILDRLSSSSQNQYPSDPKFVQRSILNSQELKTMAASGLVRFGAHTRHHFRLNRLHDENILEQEIVGCLDDIKALSDNAVPIFCYPNGDITNDGVKIVSQHYRGACTTVTGLNPWYINPYYLKRFSLHDGNSSSAIELLATIGRGIL